MLSLVPVLFQIIFLLFSNKSYILPDFLLFSSFLSSILSSTLLSSSLNKSFTSSFGISFGASFGTKSDTLGKSLTLSGISFLIGSSLISFLGSTGDSHKGFLLYFPLL